MPRVKLRDSDRGTGGVVERGERGTVDALPVKYTGKKDRASE